MQDAGKDGALDGKLKTAVCEQLAQHFGNAEPLPKPPEQQRPTNARAGDVTRLDVGQSLPRRKPGMTARSQCRTSEAARRSNSPLASSTSLRPSARIIR
jgi:hypothetical protein